MAGSISRAPAPTWTTARDATRPWRERPDCRAPTLSSSRACDRRGDRARPFQGHRERAPRAPRAMPSAPIQPPRRGARRGECRQGSGQHSGFWRPLISLSYWLDLRVFGGQPWGFHAMNVAAHAAVSALVALVLEQAGIAALGALLAGLWFALLPAHVEPVAFVSGRTDVYCALFVLLAFLLDRRARAAGRAWPGWGATLALALALLAKEASVALLPLLAIAEWVGPARPGAPRRDRLRWLAAPAALCALYLVAHAALVPPWAASAGIAPALAQPGARGTPAQVARQR